MLGAPVAARRAEVRVAPGLQVEDHPRASWADRPRAPEVADGERPEVDGSHDQAPGDERTAALSVERETGDRDAP